jgi:hypothetical protein
VAVNVLMASARPNAVALERLEGPKTSARRGLGCQPES